MITILDTLTKKDILIEKLEEYIKLLGDEIDSMSPIAFIHGWTSKRIDKGEQLRKEIEQIKNEIKRT